MITSRATTSQVACRRVRRSGDSLQFSFSWRRWAHQRQTPVKLLQVTAHAMLPKDFLVPSIFFFQFIACCNCGPLSFRQCSAALGFELYIIRNLGVRIQPEKQQKEGHTSDSRRWTSTRKCSGLDRRRCCYYSSMTQL